MTRHAFVPLALAAVFLAGLCLSAPAALAAKTRKPKKQDFTHQIEDLEQQWRLATINADVPAMDRLLSEDYVGISMSGQVNTKMQQLDRLRNRVSVISRLVLTDVQVKIVGTVGIVTSLAEVDGTNETGSVAGLYRYTRVYQRLPSGVWKITNFEATRVPPRNAPVAASIPAGSRRHEQHFLLR